MEWDREEFIDPSRCGPLNWHGMNQSTVDEALARLGLGMKEFSA